MSEAISDTIINVSELYQHTGTAKLGDLPAYEAEVLTRCPAGGHILFTGRGPIWLYLRLAHALHGKARSLSYESPEAGKVEIFNHSSR
jgi:hypothetical protein